MNLQQLHREVGQLLSSGGIEEPRREAALLLAHFLAVPLSAVYAKPEMPIAAPDEKQIRQAASRRAAHEPMAYILGITDFAGIRILVGPGVLIPRADSELLVETGLAACVKLHDLKTTSRPLQILDTCTGTGCIGISLLVFLQQRSIPAELCLTETDPTAMEYARKNLALHDLTGKVRLYQNDLFPDDAALRWDLILANPPYIPSPVIDGLMPEVRCHEPILALDGGPDGLNFYRRLIDEGKGHLNPGGWLLVEHGFDQATAIRQLFLTAGCFELIPVVCDYGRRPRVSGGQLTCGCNHPTNKI